MSASEQQAEELEVLRSIFDGDQAFSITPENAIQYMFGEKGEGRSFLLEMRWPPSYPDIIPEFSLDLFYNKHLNSETKTTLLTALTTEAENLMGSPMTYALIELVKDRFEELMEKQVQQVSVDVEEGSESEDETTDQKRGQEKTEKLTKAQKRRLWDKGQANEDKPRGYNWVDVVKHLSQSGQQ